MAVKDERQAQQKPLNATDTGFFRSDKLAGKNITGAHSTTIASNVESDVNYMFKPVQD